MGVRQFKLATLALLGGRHCSTAGARLDCVPEHLRAVPARGAVVRRAPHGVARGQHRVAPLLGLVHHVVRREARHQVRRQDDEQRAVLGRVGRLPLAALRPRLGQVIGCLWQVPGSGAKQRLLWRDWAREATRWENSPPSACTWQHNAANRCTPAQPRGAFLQAPGAPGRACSRTVTL